FANFCNAVLVAEAGSPMPSLPVLSEKSGADGGFDGEWDLPADVGEFSNPFAEKGWNVFQFKARGITGRGRRKDISEAKSNIKGALADLITRLKAAKIVKRYVLFTNLQLGLETESTTVSDAVLSQDRADLAAAIRHGNSHD